MHFPVRPGDSYNRTGQELIGQLDFTLYRNPPLARLPQQRDCLAGTPGLGITELHPTQECVRVVV